MSRGEEYSHNLRHAGQTQLHRYMVESPAVSLFPITINNVRLTKLVMPLIRLSLLQQQSIDPPQADSTILVRILAVRSLRC
jgi:hypothetical protein